MDSTGIHVYDDDHDAAAALNDMKAMQAAIDAASAELTLPITPSTDDNKNNISIFPYSDRQPTINEAIPITPSTDDNNLSIFPYSDRQPINECSSSIKKTIENVVLPPIISGKKTNTNKSILKKPKKMTRAKHWSKEVENLFRYQSAGFRDYNEYIEVYEEPEVWIDEVNENFNGLVRCLRTKQTGFYLYFRQTRECEDKYLNKIKLYEY
jgi:hypothetical protein